MDANNSHLWKEERLNKVTKRFYADYETFCNQQNRLDHISNCSLELTTLDIQTKSTESAVTKQTTHQL